MQVNVYEAKSKLSALLEKAVAGEDVVIAKSGKPIAKLVPLLPPAASRSGVRFGGLSAAELQLSSDFYNACTDDELLGE